MDRPGQYWNHLECRWEPLAARPELLVPEQASDEPGPEQLSAVSDPLLAGTD